MAGNQPTPHPDRRVEQAIGRVLRVGVLLAAAVVAVGAVILLSTQGNRPADFGTFRGQPASLTSVGAVVRGALALDGAAIVQLGLVLLMATPVARVALTLVAFAIQRDRLYVGMTALVLVLLLSGLVWG